MRRHALTLFATTLGLGACGQGQDGLASHEEKLPTTCYVLYPSPVELLMATEPVDLDSRLEKLLQRDLPGRGQLFEFSSATQRQPVDLKKGRFLPRRLFFVTAKGHPKAGSLWMIFGHFEGTPASSTVIATGVDPTVVRFMTDSPQDARQKQLELYRIAIVDRETRSGPTFVSTNEGRRFVRYEHDSDYVRDEWEKGECLGRPLTAIPADWERRRR